MFRRKKLLPPDANYFPLLFFYLVNDSVLCKTLCVVNSSPCIEGTVTIGKIFARSSEQSSPRAFWALSVLHNHHVVCAYESNTYTEVESPVPPLYVHVEDYHC